MQAESGQSLRDILKRKEFERVTGRGVFFWGIGNSLGDKRQAFLSGEVTEIVFSKMLSRPKRIDTDPSGVAIWTQYQDMYGDVKSIPEYALLLSRAYNGNRVKRHHYALVCYSENALSLDDYGVVNIAKYKNYGSTNPRIGSSQVTAVIEPSPSSHATTSERIYEINMLCQAVAPFFVKLANPIIIDTPLVAKLQSAINNSRTSQDYLATLTKFRQEICRCPNQFRY